MFLSDLLPKVWAHLVQAGDAESAGQRYTSTLRSSATVGAAFPDPILGPLPASEGQSLLGTTASAQFVSRVGIK